ncbi:MAG: hypothetical protein JW395_3452 [Nitrospira sp.]|nr:hypothetical protein [Nitrospira sp.]
MGQVVPFTGRVSAELGVKPQRPRKWKKGTRPVYVGVNIYIEPEPVRRRQIVKRSVLHGILSSWNWKLTKGLVRQLFIGGGVFRVHCKAPDIADIQEQIELRLPDLLVRRVRAA